MTTFDSVAQFYAAGRTGYSNELYSMLFQYGLGQRQHVLDIGCGTGLASRFFIENGFRVTGVDVSVPMLEIAKERFPSAKWVEGSAEALPFEPSTFDAAISGQTFHHVDRKKAIEELLRILRPGGIAGIWWKEIMTGDPVGHLREQIATQMGFEPPVSWLKGGFKEFYASALAEPTLRIVPWHVTMSLDAYMNYERSRTNVRKTFGPKAKTYFEELERRLRDMIGDRPASLPLSYVQYIYMGRKPLSPSA